MRGCTGRHLGTSDDSYESYDKAYDRYLDTTAPSQTSHTDSPSHRSARILEWISAAAPQFEVKGAILKPHLFAGSVEPSHYGILLDFLRPRNFFP